MDFHTKKSTQVQSTRSQDLILFNKEKKLNHIAHLTVKSLQAFTLEGEGRLVIVKS